jgi:hypothetical protein
MKITVKQLKQLIRENVQEQMQKEGIDEIFGFGGKPKGIFATNTNLGGDFSDAIRNYAERSLFYAIKKEYVDRNDQKAKEKVIQNALEQFKNDLPKDPKQLGSYVSHSFHSSSYPEFAEKWDNALNKSGYQVTDQDISKIKGIIDGYLVGYIRDLTYMQTVKDLKESIRAIVREEVKRQLRSNR